MRTLFQGIFAAALFVSSAQTLHAEEPKELRIIRVTPTGDNIPETRQIVIEFNRPVVAIGKMERNAEEVGAVITPALNCQWRWLNTSSLACQLDDKDKMALATSYTLTLKPVITAEDGGKLTQGYEAKFTTSPPEISSTSFKTWKGPESPVIRLVFNQPVTQSSVAAHIYMTPSAQTASHYTLDITPDPDDQEKPTILPIPGEKTIAFLTSGRRKPDDQLTTKDGQESRRIWLVQPKKLLPAGSDMTLNQEAGLVSALGPVPGSGKDSPVVTFTTFPALQFTGVHCSDSNDEEVIIPPGTVQTQDKLCNPLRGVSLGFSVPVLRSQVKDNLTMTPDLANGRKDFNPWGDEDRDWSRLDQDYSKKEYMIGLPVGLKAAQSYTLTLAGKKTWWRSLLDRLMHKPEDVNAGLEDEFGRALSVPVTLNFSTGHRNPNFLLEHQTAILEKNIDTDVPLYINNLTSTTLNYRALSFDSARIDLSYKNNVPTPQDVQFMVPMNVRTMLNGKSGALYGTLQTQPETKTYTEQERRLFAEVTPYQVHVKLGHFQSLAWVTDLASGQPVKGAKVTIYKDALTSMGMPKDILATAESDSNGLALFPGTEKIDPDLTLSQVYKDEDTRLFLRVDKDGDMALMPLSSDFSVDMWSASNGNFSESTRQQHGHMHAWGMTAQGIYKAGDTIQYKIYVRDEDNQTLIPPPDAKYSLVIIDPAGKKAGEVKNLKLSEFGSYAGELAVPKTAAVGWYHFHLKINFADKDDNSDATEESADKDDNSGAENSDNGDDAEENDSQDTTKSVSLRPLRVLVSDFTPSPFHVENALSGDHFKAGDTMQISANAKLHSGGPYTDASDRTTIILKSRQFTSSNEAAKDYQFDSFTGQTDTVQLSQTQLKLDAKGEAHESFALPQQKIVFGQLQVESAVQDDRGKSVATMANAEYAGVDRLVGLKSPQWVYDAKKPATLQTIVVDDHGVPVAGVAIDIQIEQQIVNTAKVKGAGNAYLSDITVDWKKISNCAVTSKDIGQDCSFTPPAAGTYRMTASIKDTHNNAHQTQVSLWVTGSDYVQWNDQSESALPIVPEKTEYHVGDTARYLVRNPYPGAKALVTIERYGVIDSFVKTLDGSAPVIEFPVKPDYLPGFYLSVVVQSPRVDKSLGEGQVDLGKPAFRMGYVSVPVRDKYKEMQVDVKVAQDVYKPRDTIAVDLTAAPRMVTDKPQPVELAVAVLDESVFDLIAGGLDSYDPYKGFYDLDSLDLKNFSLLTRLVGRQKFEKKGANPGGDGGADTGMRNIFKYVSYWNPSIPVDKGGKAHIEFQAPDNLTGWRILALAVTPGDRMGLGEGKFKVNQPIEIRPVMPNQIREGDKFQAGFSVMNRTDKDRTLKVDIEATGDIKGEKLQKNSTEITLGSYKRSTVFLPLETIALPVNREVQEGEVHFRVRAGDDADKDGLEYTVPVNKSRTTDVAANYGTTTDKSVQERIAFPDNIYTDTGDVSVVLSPSVIANIAGAFRYMRDYPYLCWEQILTKGVMAANYKELKAYLPKSLVWPDAEKLPQQMLDDAASFQAPNGGMAYFVAMDTHVDPYLSAYTALAFNWLRKDGYTIPAGVEERLHAYLKNFLQNDVAPDFYQAGMASTVRAVALAALAEDGKVTKDDLMRYQPHLKDMSLFGKANFLQAAVMLKDTTGAAKEAVDMIFASGNETGGKFMFNETYDDGYARILATPLRDNCAILDALVSYGNTEDGKELIGDKPFKLVRMITQSRGRRDYWENTQENMFCMNALVNYARKYEAVKPDMDVTASLDDQKFGETSFKAVTDPAATLTRTIMADDPGKTKTLAITREGEGRLYYATRLRYASKTGFDKAVNAGMDIHREYSVQRNGKWTLLSSPIQVKRGEIVRIDLYLSLPSARNYVVVNDPLPGGLETVNTDLATASTVDAAAATYDQAGGSMWFKFSDWHEYDFSFWSFYHQELRHDSARFYSDWLAAGNYHLSYAAQVIAEGEFNAPPTLAEEMYDPDVYGRSVAAQMIAKPQE